MKVFQSSDASNLLKAFVPQEMVASHAVASTCLANALDCLKILAHGPESNQDDFAHALQSISSILQDSTLVAYHRPLFRLTTMTHYKKFVHACHQRVLDQEKQKLSAENAKVVVSLVEKLEHHGASLNKLLSSGSLSFQHVPCSVEESDSRV